MKKLLVAFLVIILIVSILVVGGISVLKHVLANNPYAIPEGYTGGFKRYKGDINYTYYWVETYDECVAAIEKLESHGSKIKKSLILSEECEGMDVKYHFQFRNSKTHPIVFGEDPFDRYSGDVLVYSYVFFEDVEIEELVYSYVADYATGEIYYVNGVYDYNKIHKEFPDFTSDDFEVEIDKSEFYDGRVSFNGFVSYKDYQIYQFYGEPAVFDVSDEDIDAVLRSVVVVGNQ